MARHQPITIRMQSKIKVADTGCHEWQGTRGPRTELSVDPMAVYMRERQRQRYHEDPEFKRRYSEYQRAWRRKQRDETRFARMQTPEWQAKQQERADRLAKLEAHARLQAMTYSMPEIAALAGVNRSTVLRWIEGGRLQAIHTGDKDRLGWRVTANVLFPFLARRQERKRPKRNIA